MLLIHVYDNGHSDRKMFHLSSRLHHDWYFRHIRFMSDAYLMSLLEEPSNANTNVDRRGDVGNLELILSTIERMCESARRDDESRERV